MAPVHELKLKFTLDEIEHGHCGTRAWRDWIREINHRVREKSMPRRSLVYIQAHSGLADRLVATMSAFWASVVLGRAFELYSEPNTVPFSTAYDWASSNIDPLADYEPFIKGGENKDHFGFTWGPFDASGLSLLGNLSASNSDKDVLFYWGQQGWTHNLFHNKYHSRALFEMGLRVDTAFGCAMNFLMRPNQEVRGMFAKEFEIMDDPYTLKIGIQVRYGDSVLLNPEFATEEDKQRIEEHANDFSMAEPFFQCAQALEERYSYEGQRIVWFLVSDNVKLRHHAKKIYGDKILTPTDVPVEHSSRGTKFDTHIGRAPGEKASQKGFQVAVGENWLLGMADLHIISHASGFGRTAAFRSLHQDNIFTFAHFGDGVDSNCSRADGFTRTADAQLEFQMI